MDHLLAQYVWADATFVTRSSQLKNLEPFCDEYMLSVRPVTEGDVLAYSGYFP